MDRTRGADWWSAVETFKVWCYAAVYLLAGLGNHPESYARSRHNVGFLAIEQMRGAWDGSSWRQRFSCRCARARVGAAGVILLAPLTLMNRSGQGVGAAARYWRCPGSSIYVVHDDVDLPLGKIKVKLGGGDGGHKGVRSVAAALGPGFWRIRIGVGRPREPGVAIDRWVLGQFAADERVVIADRIDQISRYIGLLLGRDPSRFCQSLAGSSRS